MNKIDGIKQFRYLKSKDITKASTEDMKKLFSEMYPHIVARVWVDKHDENKGMDIYLDNGQIIMMRPDYCNVRTIIAVPASSHSEQGIAG